MLNPVIRPGAGNCVPSPMIGIEPRTCFFLIKVRRGRSRDRIRPPSDWITQAEMEIVKKSLLKWTVLAGLMWASVCPAQIEERTRPAEWDLLVPGGRFMDRFQPMRGQVLSRDTWGADKVIPRYVDNGIEDQTWSWWGGNIIQGDDGLYHLFVCGWLESSPKGHYEWGNSTVFDTVSESPTGPFTVRREIGKGHNPEIFRAADDRYVIYVIDARYVSDSLDGPWEYGQFAFNPRDREIIEGLSNLSFARREDGSLVMVCRGGGIWISRTGLSPWNQITDRRVYPPVDGRFEDPVIWRDEVQYHMIVNDWSGRIAWYLRSPDGINWVVDPGEAYAPGIAVHEDGLVEDWFKFERLKILQDTYGRAIQANFAVIDVFKYEDKASDNHSSKNISIPLNPGLLLEILNGEPVTADTGEIRVRIRAEAGFNPLEAVDVYSLRFGASAEVNFGRGSRALHAKVEGRDLVVTFDGMGSGINAETFAPKLIGRTRAGGLLFGYARLPGREYLKPILSARKPTFSKAEDHWQGILEVQNFGQVASGEASLTVEILPSGEPVELGRARVPALQPYEKATLSFACKASPKVAVATPLKVTIRSGDEVLSTFNSKLEGDGRFPPVRVASVFAPAGESNVRSSFQLGEGRALIGTEEHGRIYRTTDSGQSWQPAFDGGAAWGIADVRNFIRADDGNHYMTTTEPALVARSGDEGRTWTVVCEAPGSRTVGLVQLDNGVILAGLRRSENGLTSLIRSEDYFETFDYIPLSTTEPRQNVTCFGYWGGPEVLAGVGFEGPGKVYKSTDYGRTWSKMAEFPEARDLLDFFRADGKLNVLASGISTLYQSGDDGDNWTEAHQVWSRGFLGQCVPLEWKGRPYLLMSATDQRKETYRHLVLISDDQGASWHEWVDLVAEAAGKVHGANESGGGASNLCVVAPDTIVVGVGNHAVQGRVYTLKIQGD